MINNLENIRQMNTEKLLYYISKRLSSNPNCKDCLAEGHSYSVIIKDMSDSMNILMYPKIYVYPNRYRKSTRDKQLILMQALRQFDDIDVQFVISGVDNGVSFNLISIHDLKFIPGKYDYISSTTHRCRKWVRSF